MFPSSSSHNCQYVRTNASSRSRASLYSVKLSIHGEVLVAPALTGKSPVWLSQEGACAPGESEAVIRLDRENEPTVERTGEADVAITRVGRTYRLKPGVPVRVFKDDVLRVGGVDIAIAGLAAVASVSRPSRRQFLRVLCTIAAAFMLCSFGANAYAQSPDPGKGAAQADGTSGQGEKNCPRGKFCGWNVEKHECNGNPDDGLCFKPDCTDGQVMCLNDNRYECADRRWKLIEECKKPSHCESDRLHNPTKTYCENAEPCVNGHYLCDYDDDHDIMYKCKNRKWVLEKQCGELEECVQESDTKAECVEEKRLTGKLAMPRPSNECIANQTICNSGNTILRCDPDYTKWKYVKVCDAPMDCRMIDGKAECVPPEGK